jgi:thymidine kinase
MVTVFTASGWVTGQTLKSPLADRCGPASWLKGFCNLFQGTGRSGKTELMTEAVTAIESLSGKHVMILAPSSPSVEVLRTQGFTRANTLQQFELNPELQQAVKRQVLWVDEAGFLSVHQMLELQVFAVAHDCRLIVTGDTK